MREPTHSRRDFLSKTGLGFGSLALAVLLREESAVAEKVQSVLSDPLAAKAPHFAAKAKHVVLIFLQGGASHVDTFDPKPALQRLDGKTLPASFQTEGLRLQFLKASESKLMGSRFSFRKYGQSGIEISDLFQHVGAFADDLAVIRSCYHDSFIHGPALNLLYTGSILLGRPGVGSWVVYGLGSEADNLPAFIVMSDGRTNKNWYSAGFLPAAYQGTVVHTEGTPITNLTPPHQIITREQRLILDQVNRWNQRHLQARSDDSRLAARIANYELAFRMQMAAPELIDLSREPEHVHKLYGTHEKSTAKFGHTCLLARRMVERGVRFVQLTVNDWDAHVECDKNHLENAQKIDKPIAGLLTDLKRRGLLDSTLVVCTGEFGRTPVMQGNRGRDHNPYGFSTWMAGGGIVGGKVIGSTDEFGFRAVEDKVHVHDLHATILSLLGLDHKKLTFFFQGRDQRLTDVGGDNNLAERLIRT